MFPLDELKLEPTIVKIDAEGLDFRNLARIDRDHRSHPPIYHRRNRARFFSDKGLRAVALRDCRWPPSQKISESPVSGHRNFFAVAIDTSASSQQGL